MKKAQLPQTIPIDAYSCFETKFVNDYSSKNYGQNGGGKADVLYIGRNMKPYH